LALGFHTYNIVSSFNVRNYIWKGKTQLWN
jgi:hypothetical protein